MNCDDIESYQYHSWHNYKSISTGRIPCLLASLPFITPSWRKDYFMFEFITANYIITSISNLIPYQEWTSPSWGTSLCAPGQHFNCKCSIHERIFLSIENIVRISKYSPLKGCKTCFDYLMNCSIFITYT